MNEELKTLLSRPTASVPEVGRICFGLGPKGSYDAAKRGDIPTVKVGGGDERPRLKVPTARLRPMLGLESVS